MNITRRLIPIGIAGLLIALPSSAVATNPDTEHLPDLTTRTPSEMRIENSGGSKLLRFSNIADNVGDGRLELRPQNSATDGTTQAFQGIYSHTATGTWYKVREVAVGTFVFHANHSHWHFDNFAKYELLALAPGGGPGAVLKVGLKTTFCLIDVVQIASGAKGGAGAPPLAHASPRTYQACGQSSTTGISVGWGDRYGYNLSGQWVDITGVADGIYWLKSTVNYDQRLLEKDYTNNVGMVKVQIVGNTVTVPGATGGGK